MFIYWLSNTVPLLLSPSASRARGGHTQRSYALNINLISPHLPVAE